MRILLDESVPRPLGSLLIGHDVGTVTQMGWTSLGNGELLRQAAPTFDVLLTADQNLEFQQNLAKLPIAVVVLVAPSNRLESLEPLVPAVLEKVLVILPRVAPVAFGDAHVLQHRLGAQKARRDRNGGDTVRIQFGGHVQGRSLHVRHDWLPVREPKRYGRLLL